MILSFVRRIPFQHVTSILFLVLTAVLLAGGLGEVVRGARLSAFIPVGMTAALVGWGMGARGFNGWLAWGGMVFGGAALLWGSTAQFGGPLLRLAESLPAMIDQTFLWVWNQKVAPDFSVAASAWLSLVTQSSGLWQRVMQWVQGLQTGGNRYDPVVYVLLWSFLLWLIAAWEGWFMRREQVLNATAPSLALLAEVIYITGTEVTSLWVMLAITLLLMGITYFRITFTGWMKRGVDYAEIILDTTISIIFTITLALALLAWAAPSISIQQIVDTIREHSIPAKQGAPGLAETLGLKTVSEKAISTAPQINASMPVEHVIGAGPDLSRDLVMSIRTGEISPGQAFEPVGAVPYHRWRSSTLDRYTGIGWANTPVLKSSYAANAPIFAQIPVNYHVLHQTIRLAGESSGILYWDGILQSVDQPFDAAWRTKPQIDPPLSDIPFSDADMFGAFSPAKSYQVTSLIMVTDEKQLRAASGAYSDAIRNRYLALPERVPERVLALAREITATAPTPYDQAQAIERYLRKTYPYTLNIPAPPGDRDVVDYFLFDLKKGFCDYYATAMVVLVRAVGLPARIVFGYANGSYNQTSGEYNVVRADAHAWVEVYFPKIGWVEFDPTANQPEIDRQLPLHPPDNQANFANPSAQLGSLMVLIQGFAADFTLWGFLSIVGLTVIVTIFQIGEFWFLTNIPTVRAMQIIYRGLYSVGRNVVGSALASETADEFAALLRSRLKRIAQKKLLQKTFVPATGQLNLLTELYSRAIYTPRPPEKSEMHAALHAWQALRWRLLLANVMTIASHFISRPGRSASSKHGELAPAAQSRSHGQ